MFAKQMRVQRIINCAIRVQMEFGEVNFKNALAFAQDRNGIEHLTNAREAAMIVQVAKGNSGFAISNEE